MKRARALERAGRLGLGALAFVAVLAGAFASRAEGAAPAMVSIQLRSAAVGVQIRISLDGAEIHAGTIPPLPSGGESGPVIETVAARELAPGSRHLLEASVASLRGRLVWQVAPQPQWIVISYEESSTPNATPTIGFAIQDGAAAGK
jgi:hypothetical protein